MGPALILYGSKARGDFRSNSDVDLILASEGDMIGAPSEAKGVSVHRYPKGWLEKSAASGSLFAYHVAFEGAGLEDRGDFLERLRTMFQRKASYAEDIQIATLVMKMLIERDWKDNFNARRRFFWALRTALIGASAENGLPVFSSPSLEHISGIQGLANLIDNREQAAFSDCRSIGCRVIGQYSAAGSENLQSHSLRSYLMTLGGIARDSVRIIEENEALADSGLAVYL